MRFAGKTLRCARRSVTKLDSESAPRHWSPLSDTLSNPVRLIVIFEMRQMSLFPPGTNHLMQRCFGIALASTEWRALRQNQLCAGIKRDLPAQSTQQERYRS